MQNVAHLRLVVQSEAGYPDNTAGASVQRLLYNQHDSLRVYFSTWNSHGDVFPTNLGTFIFTAKDAAGNVVLARQLTPLVDAGGEESLFMDITDGDALAPGVSQYVVTYKETSGGDVATVLPLSPFQVVYSAYVPGGPVTTPVSQQPLAKGDKGDQGNPGAGVWKNNATNLSPRTHTRVDGTTLVATDDPGNDQTLLKIPQDALTLGGQGGAGTVNYGPGSAYLASPDQQAIVAASDGQAEMDATDGVNTTSVIATPGALQVTTPHFQVNGAEADFTGASNGDVLKYNGSKWTHGVGSGGGGEGVDATTFPGRDLSAKLQKALDSGAPVVFVPAKASPPATGTITCSAKSAYHNNDSLTIADGVNSNGYARFVFEYKVDGGYVASGGNVHTVDISGATTAVEVATALCAAINAWHNGPNITNPDFRISAQQYIVNVGLALRDNVVHLTNEAEGTIGNVPIVKSNNNPDVVVGMSGGDGYMLGCKPGADDWQSGATYAFGDRVYLATGYSGTRVVYRCIVPGTTGTTPPFGLGNNIPSGGTSRWMSLGYFDLVLAPWAQNHSYSLRDEVWANGGGYKCIVAGTSSNSGTGPTGTGLTITDGGVTWMFIGDGNGPVIMSDGQTLRLGAAAYDNNTTLGFLFAFANNTSIIGDSCANTTIHEPKVYLSGRGICAIGDPSYVTNADYVISNVDILNLRFRRAASATDESTAAVLFAGVSRGSVKFCHFDGCSTGAAWAGGGASATIGSHATGIEFTNNRAEFCASQVFAFTNAMNSRIDDNYILDGGNRDTPSTYIDIECNSGTDWALNISISRNIIDARWRSFLNPSQSNAGYMLQVATYGVPFNPPASSNPPYSTGYNIIVQDNLVYGTNYFTPKDQASGIINGIIFGNSQRCLVSGNLINGAGNVGIGIQQGRNMTVLNNDISDMGNFSGYGQITLWDSQDCLIQGNRVAGTINAFGGVNTAILEVQLGSGIDCDRNRILYNALTVDPDLNNSQGLPTAFYTPFINLVGPGSRAKGNTINGEQIEGHGYNTPADLSKSAPINYQELNTTNKRSVQTQGWLAPGDGGAADWFWNPNDTRLDDGLDVVRAYDGQVVPGPFGGWYANGAGRWNRATPNELCTAGAAIPPNTFVKRNGAGKVVAAATTDDMSDVYGLCLDAAAADGDKVRVVVQPEYRVRMLSDGSGAIADGDHVSLSTTTGGQAKKVTSGGMLGLAEGAPFAVGTITTSDKTAYHNNDNFTVNDGVNAALTFEYKVDSGYVAVNGRVTVDISGVTGNIAAALCARFIQMNPALLNVNAFHGTGVVTLVNNTSGSVGNHAITVGAGPDVVTGMSDAIAGAPFLALFRPQVSGGSSPTPDTWHAPTLLNSWVNYGAPYYDAGYFKDANGFVHLRGLIKSGGATAIMFTLPAGYRPSKTTYQITIGNGGLVANVSVDSSGNVFNNASIPTDSFSLDGITFYAES